MKINKEEIAKTFLDWTLFLLFGSKEWKKGKRPIPPVYIAGILIFFLIIFILIF